VRPTRSPGRSAASTCAVANLPVAFGAAGLITWLVTVCTAPFSSIGALGLITVVGWPFVAALALVSVGFALELLHDPLRPGRLLALIVALIVTIFGTASAVEPTARLADSYVHAGFVQYVLVHGHVLNNYDARFSWPGGFSLGAVLVVFAGQANALALLRWAPLVFEVLYLAPLLVIAKASGVSRRAGWLGVALFYATNWIDQDYFSPQALNFLFFLVVLAVVLSSWRMVPTSSDADHQRRTRRWLAEARAGLSRRRLGGHDALALRSRPVTLVLLGLVVIVALASAMSHQLTPYALILGLFACLLSRRLGRPELVIVAALLAAGWLSLGASNYWEGHLSTIFGPFGQLGSTFGSNVSSRVTGSSSHRLVVDLRLLVTAALYLLAGIGICRRRGVSRSIELLAAAPFLLLVAQDYGGEGLLRVVLFGLPFTGLLAASALLPTPETSVPSVLHRVHRGGRAMTVSVVILAIFAFAVTTAVVRGGNDAYEAFSTGERSAVDYTFAHVTAGQTVGMVSPFLPIGAQDVGSVNLFIANSPNDAETLSYNKARLLRAKPQWIILSQSQEAWGEIVGGYPKGWEKGLEGTLENRGYQVVAAWPTASVLLAGRGA
jgi:hypothetical protein